jgi:hypothetical protein
MTTGRRKCHGVMAMGDGIGDEWQLPRGPAKASSGTEIGSVNTTDVYVTEDSLAWLIEQVRGDSTLYADTVELDVNDGGTLVFDTDGDSVVVNYEEGEDD